MVPAAKGLTAMSWTTERPGFAEYYWFKGSLAGKLTKREVLMATVVEVGTVGDRFVVWFPRGECPVPISECDGRWEGLVEVPR
jgi:hypothetical protein